MTQQEFEKRFGKSVSTSQFESANKMYMACSLDKDKFVQEYKLFSLQSSDVVADMVMEIEQLRHQVETLSNELTIRQEEQISERIDFGYFLAAYSGTSSAIRNKAIEILGIKKYLTAKIDLGIDFDEPDNKLILELCK